MAAKDTQVGGDHYKKLGNFQPWEVLKAWLTPEEYKGYMKGTAIAYLAREADKGGRQDIEKAMHTLAGYLELTATPAPEVDLEFPLGTEFLVGKDVARGLQTDGVGENVGGWIHHNSGIRPVGLDAVVDIKCREGMQYWNQAASGCRWSHAGTSGDIMQYRVVRHG